MSPLLKRRRVRGPRRHGVRPIWALAAGVLTVVLIVGFMFIAESANNGLPILSYRTLKVQLPNVGHLQQHDPVDIAGVLVGQVQKETTDHNEALITLQMQGVGPIPANSQAIIRANGLLGARYVELEPGNSHRMLPNGGTLVETNPVTTYTFGLPEALNLFDTKTRTALSNMINGFGEGFEGRGAQLGQAIDVGTPSGHDFDEAVDAILARPGAAYTFLGKFDSGTTALDASRNQLVALLSPAAKGLEPLIQDRTDLRNSINGFDHMESAVNVGLAAPALTLFSDARHLASVGDRVLPTLPTALKATNALLVDAQKPLDETKPVLDQVPGTVPAVLSTLANLKPDLAPVKQALVNLVQPVTTLSEHGCDIQNFADNVQSLVSWGTQPGGHWGPDVGFPIGVAAGGQEINDLVNVPAIAGTFPHDTAYEAPCYFSPGGTFATNLLGVLDQSIGSL